LFPLFHNEIGQATSGGHKIVKIEKFKTPKYQKRDMENIKA
jgi:hypothetical protein